MPLCSVLFRSAARAQKAITVLYCFVSDVAVHAGVQVRNQVNRHFVRHVGEGPADSYLSCEDVLNLP